MSDNMHQNQGHGAGKNRGVDDPGLGPTGEVITNVEAGGLHTCNGTNMAHLPSTLQYGKIGDGVKPPCTLCKYGWNHTHGA